MDFEKPIQEGYEFNGSEIVSEAWSMFKKHAGSFLGATILFLIIYLVLAVIPLINVFSVFVLGALYAGYLVYAGNMKTGNQKMSDFFSGFTHIGQIALYYLVFFLMILPLFAILFSVLIPFELLGALMSGSITPDEFGAEFAAGLFSAGNMGKLIGTYLVVMIIMLYLSISYAMTLPLIVNGKLGFWKAMETSRKTVGKKFFSFFGFYLVYGILAMLFMIVTIGFGLFILYPMMFLVSYVMYDKIFDPSTGMVDEIENFGAGSVDINSESQE